jgi:flagellar biosynthesis GTPase FlhF
LATQRRFEGSTLAAVLAKVQKEIGPNATISSAQKVRSGGMGGFFAREKFEVLVEIPDPGEAPKANQSTDPVLANAIAPTSADEDYDPVASLLGLAEKISKEDVNEIKLDPVPVPKPQAAAPKTPSSKAQPPKVAPPKTEQAKMEMTPTAEESTVDEDAAGETFEAVPDEPQISTESDSFAEVLSRVAFQAHMTEEQERSQQEAAAERAQRRAEDIPGRPPFLDGNAGNSPAEGAAQPTEQSKPLQAEVITGPALETPAPVAPAAEASAPAAPTPAPQVVETQPVAPQAAAAQPVTSPTPQSSATQASPTHTPMSPAPTNNLPVVHNSGDQGNSPGTPEVAAQPQKPRTRISDHPLAALGLPTEYIPVGVEISGLQEALTSALERLLPKVPDIRPSKGSIIAVVGSRFESIEVAEALAEQFGRPPEEIVLASQTYKGKGAANVLRTVRNAEDAQRSWSRRPRPTIVAIEAAPGSRDATWAEHVLTALEPIATYGVADATRKADDIKAWANSLGGVDCLAVNNIEQTISPAAVLATGIPVDRVDGRRVSPAFWSLLLTERLLAA